MEDLEQTLKDYEKVIWQEYAMPVIALTILILSFVVIVFAPNHHKMEQNINGVSKAEVVGRWGDCWEHI